MKDWLSTKDAMNILGVGATTIKRWADNGYLETSRTAGGHRRFNRGDVMRLANEATGRDLNLPEAEIWAHRLRAPLFQGNLPEQIRELQDDLGNWFDTADFLGRVLDEIGIGWANGTVSTIDEHIATARLQNALATVAASITVSDTAPICRLVALSGERHEMGLYLARVCFRASGYETTFIGGDTPVAELGKYILENEQRVVGISASPWSTDYGSLEKAYSELSAACRKKGTELILGGKGAWPKYLEHAHRCPSFVDLPDILELFA